jgi:hypothetical protein
MKIVTRATALLRLGGDHTRLAACKLIRGAGPAGSSGRQAAAHAEAVSPLLGDVRRRRPDRCHLGR